MNHQKENETNIVSPISVIPISHASLILAWDGFNIYVDPVDEKKANIFKAKPAANIVLITDIHGDHFDIETLKKITTESTVIIAPQAVADMMPEELKSKVHIISNGEKSDYLGFSVEAIPMYNLPGPSESYHTKGRGNGYIIEMPVYSGLEKTSNTKRIYISGDTAGIPEMRALKNIDIAFVAMNLPYTMGVEEAADAVLAFKPKEIYPYHYRTPEGFSDVVKFKEIINTQNPDIEVIQLDWYPKTQ
ncbi:MAG TPA: MBL fold metallo-hydrolase [Candidatus Paceibacterota bacterium]|nr:MBL fold metallo-hydrolase [Candidatus Paceibacterota bacterium]